jgi:hypothetical protein
MNRREAAVGFWRGCVVAFVGVGLWIGWLPPPSLVVGGWKDRPLQRLALNAFFGAALCMIFACAATSGADPGLVEWDLQGISAALQHVMEYGGPPPDFDDVSMLRRPLRSKLCRESGGVNIARFDHFCIWINRPIGAGNHLLFVFFVVLQILSIGLFLTLSTSLLLDTDPDVSFFISAVNAPRGGLVVMSAFGLVVLASLLFLFLFQIRGILLNVTTNEFMNMERYPHFWRGPIGCDGKRTFLNPFDKGFVGNINEFLGIGGHVEYVRLFRYLMRN